MSTLIGKILATEKNPTTIDEFSFWTNTDLILSPFDVVKVEHINGSVTFGIVMDISHITDSPSYLTSFVSNDFGNVETNSWTKRIGMNYIKCAFLKNTKNIYIPVQNESKVYLASKDEVEDALGLKDVKNPIVCGYLEMYEKKDKVQLPVNLNSDFLIGPEGAHLNISGISGLASKTSYAMFLLKAIQDKAQNDNDFKDVAFVLLNVKGRDLLSIDEKCIENQEEIAEEYKKLGLKPEPFSNVKYFYPYEMNDEGTYGKELLREQEQRNKGFRYKFIYEQDARNIDLLFSNIDDSTQTMDAIISSIDPEQGEFSCTSWQSFKEKVQEKMTNVNGSRQGKEIPVVSWRKFYRIINKALAASVFASGCNKNKHEVRLEDEIKKIKAGDVYVIDIAKQEENMQAFIFGCVMRAVSNLKLGVYSEECKNIPKRIVIFIDELNKYASTDVPKNSPILQQILDIAERGRSLGIILFSAEQFKSAIHPRVVGNCATHAYGKTNAIEISNKQYSFVPSVYKNMMTRLRQGQYIIQNPMLNSLISIKFPRPIYKQYK